MSTLDCCDINLVLLPPSILHNHTGIPQEISITVTHAQAVKHEGKIIAMVIGIKGHCQLAENKMFIYYHVIFPLLLLLLLQMRKLYWLNVCTPLLPLMCLPNRFSNSNLSDANLIHHALTTMISAFSGTVPKAP